MRSRVAWLAVAAFVAASGVCAETLEVEVVTPKLTVFRNWAHPTNPAHASFTNITAGNGAAVEFRFKAQKDVTYQVVFGLCEGHHQKPGERVIDLRLEKKVVQTVDIAKDKGHNVAGAFPFKITDADGDGWIVVAVTPAKVTVDKNAYLNVFWIFSSDPLPPENEIISGAANAKALAFVECATAYEERDRRIAAAERAKIDAWRQQQDVLVKQWLATAKPPGVPATQKFPINNEIDGFVTLKWPDGPVPALTSDRAFARRIYLDTIGRIPNEAEVAAFVADAAPDKRAKLIDALLARNDDYAINWVPFWEDALCSNGNHQGGVGTRGSFRGFIQESFKANQAYHEFFYELLSQKNYLGLRNKGSKDEDSLRNARDVAQVFLGTALKCASCHNHFLNKEWTQEKFYQFANYFSNENMEVVRCEVNTGKKPTLKFLFDGVAQDLPESANRDERIKAVTQMILSPANPRFAASLVNRLWKRSFGVGIVEPVDDFRSNRTGSHPELLQWLAWDFVAHGYDIKHTLRRIYNSRTYQLAYDAKLADAFDVTKPDEPRFFRSPQLRRLTCEQLLDSVHVVTGTGKDRLYTQDASTPLIRTLGRPSTRNEVQTGRGEEAAVLQALEFMNGEEFNKLVADSALPKELAAQAGKDKSGAIEKAFLRVFGRPPVEQEQTLTAGALAENSNEMWTDVLWSLLVSPEFQYVR